MPTSRCSRRSRLPRDDPASEPSAVEAAQAAAVAVAARDRAASAAELAELGAGARAQPATRTWPATRSPALLLAEAAAQAAARLVAINLHRRRPLSARRPNSPAEALIGAGGTR